MLVDSDVMIWHLRGYVRATERLNALTPLTISTITYMELLQGMRNRAELAALQKSLALRNTRQLPITAPISERAIELMDDLWFSQRLGMADALIAATALVHGLPLLTGNVKHFNAIPQLAIERFNVSN